MANNKKPRKRYKPKPVLADPIGFVTERIAPIAKHDTYLLDLQLRNSAAMTALLRGNCSTADMDTLIAMSNIVEGLHMMGFGKEYGEVAIQGREALISIAARAKRTKRFTPNGAEIQALNTLMELHDAQMEVITVQNMEDAIKLCAKMIREKKATVLDHIPEDVLV